MRRDSSTVVVLVGEVGEGLLAEIGQSPNASVARTPAPAAKNGEPSPKDLAPARPAWEVGALAMREAYGRQSPYVIIPEDPLADVAAAWRAMWDVASGPGGAAGFEKHAAEALAAWRDNRFELPDYYLVGAPAQSRGTGPDLYLGPLRAARPRRVAVAALADSPGQTIRVLDALRSLEHGPWWPPLDELINSARNFYAGGLAETQPTLA
jgi:hypothetical protein